MYQNITASVNKILSGRKNLYVYLIEVNNSIQVPYETNMLLFYNITHEQISELYKTCFIMVDTVVVMRSIIM